MFVGAIPSKMRPMITELATGNAPVYIGRSGNFTIDRLLCPTKKVHGNDVSLYSCVLGRILAGESTAVDIADEQFAWMRDFMWTDADILATISLCMVHLPFAFGKGLFHKRQWDAAVSGWAGLHAETKAKNGIGLEGVKLESFSAMDVVEFVKQAPAESQVFAFPPTYKGGYERLYKALGKVFKWEQPTYQIFDGDRLNVLIDELQKKRGWLLMRDEPIERLKDDLVIFHQATGLSKPVYGYGAGTMRIVGPKTKIEPVGLHRANGEISPPLQLVRLKSGQFNGLRSQYLAKGISPAAAQVCVGVTCGGQLIGAFGAILSRMGDWCQVYLLSDFSIAPTIYSRLSKLVLAAICSHEAKALFEQSFCRRVKIIGTTAFTEKAVSMKYRGLFEIHDRKPGRLNYITDAGRWSLDQGYEWWLKTHAKKSKSSTPSSDPTID